MLSGCTTSTYTYTQQTGFIDDAGNPVPSSIPVIDAGSQSDMSATSTVGNGLLPVTSVSNVAYDPSFAAYVESQESAIRTQLEKTGMQVIKKGDDLFLYMSTTDAFSYNGYQLTTYGYNTLDKIAYFLQDYDNNKTTFHVGAYNGPFNKDMTLNDIRARVTTDYLLAKHVVSEQITYSTNTSIPLTGVNPNDGYIEIKIINVNK